MQRSFALSLTVLSIGLGLAGAIFAFADSPGSAPSTNLTTFGTVTPRTRAIIAGGSAYLLGQPETILADAMTDNIVVSPLGDAVLVSAYKRRPFRGVSLPPVAAQELLSELTLTYWDARTRTAKTLMREAVRDDSLVKVQRIEWIPQTRSVFVVLSRTTIQNGQPPLSEQSLLRVDTTTGTVARLTNIEIGLTAPANTIETLNVSPSQPLAFLFGQENTNARPGPAYRSFVRLYSPRGFRPPIPLPEGVGLLEWMPDGKSVYSDRLYERNDAGKLTHRKQLTLVNLETGVVTQPDALPAATTPKKIKEAPLPRESWTKDITIATLSATLEDTSGKSQPTPVLWVRAAETPKTESAPQSKSNSGTAISVDSLLIAANSRSVTFLATEDAAAALFVRDGSLCAAPLFRLPVQAFETALRGAQRTATMSNAKQIGIAMMMYSQDYDQTLPLPGEGAKDATSPYLKNPSVFDNPGTGEPGFVYSYGGPTGQSQITSPGTTQLGYVSGPGGRAIIWADGHVTWVDF